MLVGPGNGGEHGVCNGVYSPVVPIGRYPYWVISPVVDVVGGPYCPPVAGALTQAGSERSWRLIFIAGLFGGAVIAAQFSGALANIQMASGAWPVTVAAGLLVGFGTRLGSGCTSGHGICGLSRLSMRSLVATLSFMFSGFVTVFVIRHLL